MQRKLPLPVPYPRCRHGLEEQSQHLNKRTEAERALLHFGQIADYHSFTGEGRLQRLATVGSQASAGWYVPARLRFDTAMQVDAYVIATLVLAALPAAAIARRTAKGWRTLVVFAAFLTPISIWVALVLGAALVALAGLGAIAIE